MCSYNTLCAVTYSWPEGNTGRFIGRKFDSWLSHVCSTVWQHYVNLHRSNCRWVLLRLLGLLFCSNPFLTISFKLQFMNYKQWKSQNDFQHLTKQEISELWFVCWARVSWPVFKILTSEFYLIFWLKNFFESEESKHFSIGSF